MAFDKAHLSAMAHGDGQTWWQYKSTDTKNAIDTVNYFNDAASMLKVNDLMYIIASDAVALVYVNANDGTTVDVSDGTTISATDTR